MSTENLALPIPNAVLEPYIKQAVSTAILGALDGDKLVMAAVQNVLEMKVNSEGKVDSYGSYNKYALCEILARRKITEIAQQTINEMAERMRPKIKAEIERQLKTKHSQIATALVDGMVKSLAASWNVKVEFREAV